jgi:glycosyltransferase involved in cell wall biosynthesis
MSNTCGCLVPPRDAAALARAIGSVLDQTWDENALSAQRSRSWNTVSDELLAVFESVVQTRKASPHAG